MCLYMYTHTYIAHISIYTCVYTYIHIYTRIYNTYIYIYIYLFIYIYIDTHIILRIRSQLFGSYSWNMGHAVHVLDEPSSAPKRPLNVAATDKSDLRSPTR